MKKKIIYKLSLLLLLVLGLNVIYNFTLFENDLRNFSKEDIEIKNTQAKTDIYYFGESSNVTYKKSDSTQNSISELCSLFFPKLKVTNINKYATHAGVYMHWLKQINTKLHKPKAIIITMNLRSFDATWIHSKLETQLQQAMVLSQPYPNIINRFLLSLQAFDNKTEEQREKEIIQEWKTVKLKWPKAFKFQTVKQWDDAMANGGHLDKSGNWDIKKIELACHFIKGYAFNLNEENPRIRDFDQITNWCQKNQIKLYFNLMAENIEYADSLVGKELVFLMRENRDYLKARYSKNNCVLVDNLELLKGKEFIDQDWTTEHYIDKGRMRIAKILSEQLKTQFKSEYIKAY